VVFDDVKRFFPNEVASDVDFVGAGEVDRLLREQMLRRSVKGFYGPGGVGVDVAQWVRDAGQDAILKPEVRAALAAWFTDAAPLRTSISKMAAERGAVIFAIRCPDEAVVNIARGRMTNAELRGSLIALRERLIATLANFDVMLVTEPKSSLVRRLDAVAFPESFPDPSGGECICSELTSAPPVDFNAAPEAVRKQVGGLCGEIAAANSELRRMELEYALLSASEGDMRRIQALDVGESRRVLVERRKVLNVELRKALQAGLSDTAYRDIIGRVER